MFQATTGENRPVGDIYKDLLQGIGLCDYGGRLGKSEIHKSGLQEGQARAPGYGRSSCPQVEFLLWRSLHFAVKAYQLLNQAHQDYYQG